MVEQPRKKEDETASLTLLTLFLAALAIFPLTSFLINPLVKCFAFILTVYVVVRCLCLALLETRHQNGGLAGILFGTTESLEHGDQSWTTETPEENCATHNGDLNDACRDNEPSMPICLEQHSRLRLKLKLFWA
ncbi:hypothetical protein BV898_07688 [Hypsibius exemplaris]|uniref:Uncharacterized protein n=1 Tax=Hypsibius exemplaris TaxID=2072580 RepID=A0A1W0WSX2_HYPEX|nr:hypothetical protein BV898_07688 [Hypsibius exemplaris]